MGGPLSTEDLIQGGNPEAALPVTGGPVGRGGGAVLVEDDGGEQWGGADPREPGVGEVLQRIHARPFQCCIATPNLYRIHLICLINRTD